MLDRIIVCCDRCRCHSGEDLEEGAKNSERCEDLDMLPRPVTWFMDVKL